MTATNHLTRRDFLKSTTVAGGGLVLAVTLPTACRPGTAEAAEDKAALSAWIRIAPDETVTLLIDKSEMGQGIMTALAMILADELDADWSNVRAEFAPADPAYNNTMFGSQATGGSTSIRSSWEPLRKAGAAAREMLRQAAAESWSVPIGECRAAGDGVISHEPSGRTLSYGKLAARAANLQVPENPPLKNPSAFRYIGQPLKRLDTKAKVHGAATFGLDIQVPGMLVASVERCPVFGGSASQFDAAAARAVPGVKDVIEISTGIAVVADGYWPALQGRKALDITWDEGANRRVTSATLAEAAARLKTRAGAIARSDGNAEAALAAADRVLEAEYFAPYLAHATMEPMNATAHVQPNGCDVWVPTQSQTESREKAAEITGLPLEAVRVHTTFLGGGFGRRSETDFVTDAVEISKAVGAPIKVIWSREDDMQHDYYRPASYHSFRAALDEEGWPVAWTHRIVAPSILARWAPGAIRNGLDSEAVEGAVGLPYTIANVRVDYHQGSEAIPVGWWRSVNHSQNAYATECFMDELAAAADRDPVAFRRALLGERPRHRRVLDLVAERAGWDAPAPAGHYRGVALHEAFDSIIAQVAEISIDERRRVRVHRVTCVVDCGIVINPDTIAAQMESGIVYGLTAALYGEITIDGGRVAQSNFHDYQMLRLREMPEIDVHIAARGDKPGGIGEPGTPPIAPAVANAVFAATGQPVRQLPIRLT